MRYHERFRRGRAILLALAGVVVVALVLGTALGAVWIEPVEVGRALIKPGPSDPAHVIIREIRFPRVLLAAFVGSALGAAGTTFQGLFRNPMADPYIIGVSSGAALGAAAAIYWDITAGFMGLGAVPLMAFVGALGSVALVYNLARVNGVLPVMTLLLAGVAVGSFLSSAVSLLVVMSGDKLGEIIFWLMGGFSGSGWREVKAVTPYIAGAFVVLQLFARELNAMLLGEEPAQHLGIEVEKLKLILLGAASVATAAAVSVSGLIGFVGLVVPHIVRLLIGPDHSVLLPATALVGATALVVADLAARVLLAPREIPVGIITAFFGGPFFVYLLRRRKP